jgi:hypothetical protein
MYLVRKVSIRTKYTIGARAMFLRRHRQASEDSLSRRGRACADGCRAQAAIFYKTYYKPLLLLAVTALSQMQSSRAKSWIPGKTKPINSLFHVERALTV